MSGSDVGSVNFGFAYNLIVNTGDDTNANNILSKQGSLRQFIKNANAIGMAASSTAKLSQFRIPVTDPNYNGGGNGAFTIRPTIAMPTLSDRMAIDATTQTTNIGDTNGQGPEIELDGTGIGATSRGFAVNAPGCTVRGLVINRFFDGIYLLASSTGSKIESNYIGTDVTGTADLGNSRHGVIVSAGSESSVIGGATAGAGNLISGNTSDGINIQGGGDIRIFGNFIGTDAAGTADLGNGSFGIRVFTDSKVNIIGGSAAGAGNLISGNNGGGIYLAGPLNTVQGNLIGTDAAGTGSIGGSYGLYVTADGNIIGGTAAGEANTVAYHSNQGVYITSGVNNLITGNSIFSNGSLGIDLTSGGNNDKAVPVISSITPAGVDFTIITTAGSGDTIEFFRANNAAAPAVTPDPTAGEGYLYLGSCVDNGACSGPHISPVVDADAAAGSVQAVLLSSGLSSIDVVTATATDASNNTSEFAANAYTSTCPGGVVTTTADAGFASLRECINLANSNPGTTISFNIPGPGNQSAGADSWWRISPTSALPTVTAAGTIIDGSTQTTNQGDTNSLGPEVEIRGFTTSFTYGLELNSANNTVKGLIINGFSGTLSAGIMITGASATGNTVTGNYLGTDYSSTAAVTNYIGVAIGSGAQSNTVGGTSAAERNVISGNSTYGAEIKDSGTDLNVVKGNYIGTDRLGTNAVANGTGVIIWAGAANNTIGGTAVGEGNVISGSTWNGLIIANSGSDSNVVQGNLIGTDAAGTDDLGNGASGININQGALNNTIGGTATREANTIAFNSGDGISMNSSGTDSNQVSGNAIFENGGLGIDLDPDGVGTGSGANNDKAAPSITSITPSGSDFTIIATAGNSDTIEFFRANNPAAPAVTADPSGSGEGYLYLGSCVDNGACSGPHISAVADADAAAGSVQAVLLSGGLSIGDVVTATATDTSNNTSEFAVNAYTSTCPGGVVTTTADAGFASLRECINLANSNPGTTISFNIPGPGNQSAGADSWWRISPNSALPTVTAAGTIIDATTQTVNQGDTNSQGPEIELNGVGAGASVRGLTIAGGNSTVRGLVINRFTLDGIYLVSFGGNVIEGNYIGTNATGSADLGNSGSGIYVYLSTGNTIGGSFPGTGNLISGNDYNAIEWTTGRGVMLYRADGNSVIGNYIGTDRTGTVSIGNEREGVGVSNCINNTVGGSGAGEENLISGNSGVGVWIGGGGTTGNRVLGNLIGTQFDGISPLGNSSNGVAISNTATDNIIGGSGTGEGNVIAYNTNDGVWIDGSTTDFNLISGNAIFENGGLGIDLEPDGVGTGSGANNNKAAPSITSITPSGSDFTIIATAGNSDTIEFFRANNPAAPAVTADPSGSGEGYLYLGSCVDNGACSGPHISAVADADAAAGSVQAVLLSGGLSIGDVVTATATDTSNNTSEFGSRMRPFPPHTTLRASFTKTSTATATFSMTESPPDPSSCICIGTAAMECRTGQTIFP